MYTVIIIVYTETKGGVGLSPRPKSDKSKNIRFNIRITKETSDKLEHCAEKLVTSKADVVERGIDLVKKELDEKK